MATLVIDRRVGDLASRSDTCSLCGLLYNAAKGAGFKDIDDFRCRRVGSAFKIDPDGPTILTIYVDPGK